MKKSLTLNEILSKILCEILSILLSEIHSKWLSSNLLHIWYICDERFPPSVKYSANCLVK